MILQLSGRNCLPVVSDWIKLYFGQPSVLMSAAHFLIQAQVVKEVDADHNMELLVLCVCVLTLFSWGLLGKNESVFFRVKGDSDL